MSDDPFEGILEPDVGLLRHLAGLPALPALARCEHCQDLFVLTRRDRRFCGKGCANAAYFMKHSGERLQPQDSAATG